MVAYCECMHNSPTPHTNPPVHVHTYTQVFHVPVEERRFQFDEPSFGNESRQSEIVREIIDRTGCDIEMSQAKDRSLTILVSGKPSAVVQARREILTKLQTQVS